MDPQIMSLVIALVVFLGAFFLFLYAWQTKRGPRLPWKAFSLCCLIVCGTAFAASFLLASMIDSTSYALAGAFQLDHEVSTQAAKLAVNLTAVLAASLVGFWVVRKMIARVSTLES